MVFVLLGLQLIITLISLACFVMVIIKMFQSGDTGLGVACLLLILACGLGFLVTYIMGWVKAGQYGITNIMMAWTGCIVVGIILRIAAAALMPADTITLPR